ncbi:MAG TPA: hypothetical protein VHG92_08915 [Afifellaceae bacterium]|nr:hypothetical protein [Afifellaceae bacterium]
MCGDIDDEARFDDELLARLLALAGRRYGVDGLPGQPARDIASDKDRHAFMDESFREALAAALGRVEAVPDGQRAEAIASQAIVLARLAGWLAGSLPPGADMMRTMMEAMLDGCGEPARAFAEAAEHHHHHEHGHGHGHGHSH